MDRSIQVDVTPAKIRNLSYSGLDFLSIKPPISETIKPIIRLKMIMKAEIEKGPVNFLCASKILSASSTVISGFLDNKASF